MTLTQLETTRKDLIETVKELEVEVVNIELALRSKIKEQLNVVIKDYDKDLRLNSVDIHNYYGLYFHADFGFENEEGKIDFGSTFSLGLKSGHIVEINHGSIGPFSPQNVYQIKRVRVLNKLLDDWNKIESILGKESFNEYTNMCKTLSDTRTLLEKCEYAILDEKRDTILDTAKIGAEFTYKDDTPLYKRLFNGTFEVFKMARKYIYLRSPWGAETRIEKSDFVEHVNKGWLIIK